MFLNVGYLWGNQMVFLFFCRSQPDRIGLGKVTWQSVMMNAWGQGFYVKISCDLNYLTLPHTPVYPALSSFPCAAIR